MMVKGNIPPFKDLERGQQFIGDFIMQSWNPYTLRAEQWYSDI
jgi:hypothetical protein